MRTLWKFRALIVLAFILSVIAAHEPLASWAAASLVCKEKIGPVDALLIEDFDHEYLLYERARLLGNAGISNRVLVHVRSDSPGNPNAVAKGFVGVMTQIARLQNAEIVPVREIEPITLNVASQMRTFLEKEDIRSVALVTSGFRSKRSSLIYDRVMADTGIDVHCVPVFGRGGLSNWTDTWHGIQNVAEQFSKLQYYRLFVLPFYHPSTKGSGSNAT
jgi:hypothetical protein